MKFKTKLFVFLLMLAFVTNGILLFLVGLQVQQRRKESYYFRVLTIAETTTVSINGDELAQWPKTFSESSPIYTKYKNLLQQITLANQKIGVKLEKMEILFPDPNRPGQLLHGIEAANQGDKIPAGQPYVLQQSTKAPFRVLRLQQVLPLRPEVAGVQPSYIQEAWGYGLLAHVPIHDSAGKLVGVLVVVINANEIDTQYHSFFWMGLLFLLSSFVVALMFAYLLAKHISRPLEEITKALSRIGKGDFSTHITIDSHDEFGHVEQAVNDMALGLQQRDNLKVSLAHYVSNQVAETILKTGRLPEVQGERRKITVLFCDIRNFTTLAEDLSPEEVVNLLNVAFEVMVDAIFKYNGMLDKFLGDGFMAIFGAPMEDEQQEEHAVRAAIEIQEQLKALAAKWKVERGIDFKIGVGINTGVAVVGNIGSKQRMDYTAIGDTVNLAARLEAATKELNNTSNILVSEYTHYAVRNKFKFNALGPTHVKGRHEPVQIYQVLDGVE